MLDMKFVRDNPEKVMEAVRKRNGELNLDEFLALDKERREITQQVEALKNERNTASKEIGKLKKAGENAEEKMAEVRAIGKCVVGANPASLILNRCPTGILAKSWTFWILNGVIRFPAPALRCIKAWVPVWSAA